MNMLFIRIDDRVDRNETMYVFIDVSYFDDSEPPRFWKGHEY